MFFHCAECAKNSPPSCAAHPRVTCEDCGLEYTEDSDWSGSAHSDRDCIAQLRKRLFMAEQEIRDRRP